MPSQPGQPTGGGNQKPRKFKWGSLLFSLLFIGAITLLGFWWFGGFKSKETMKSQNFFDERITENANDSNDGNYFKQLTYTQYEYKVSVVESYIDPLDSERKERSYVVHMSSSYFAGTQDKTIDGKGYYKLLDAMASSTSTPGDFHSEPASTNTFVTLLISLIPTMIIIGFFVWMAKKQGGMGDVMSSGKNRARKIISKKKFSDVAGQDEAKEEVAEVVDFLKHPDRYRAAGARIPKGILLGGPPGTGKTLLAKATAGEAKVPFFFVSASNFVEMFAGMGAKRVREMFKEARKESPAILFIDELDAVGRKRGSSMSGNDEREQTLNQILVEMDGMDENNALLIIAATNRVDVLDPALLRPGRFDRTITVSNPDIKEREQILKLHSKGKRLSPQIDFKNIAKRTPGYSGAQLENIINEATLLSVRNKTGVITVKQIDEAIDRVIAGPAKKNRVISKDELTMVAYHEAGHAVIGLKVSAAEKVQKITIIPRGKAGGYTLMTPKKETYNFKKSELESKIVSYMGGRAAEQIIYGKGEVSTGASNDIERATSIARAMVTQYGMSILGPIAYQTDQGAEYIGQTKKEYSDALAERIDEAIRELIITAEKRAIEVINENKQLLELIKDELLENETIVLEEIEYINEHLKRPERTEETDESSLATTSLTELLKDVKIDGEEPETSTDESLTKTDSKDDSSSNHNEDVANTKDGIENNDESKEINVEDQNDNNQ